jgi:pantothenate kinase-related protein Tda10
MVLANAVAAAHPDNPLLQMRGNAGSHDMELGTSTLRALREASSPSITVPIPRHAVEHPSQRLVPVGLPPVS